jgi:hypothetical protein
MIRKSALLLALMLFTWGGLQSCGNVTQGAAGTSTSRVMVFRNTSSFERSADFEDVLVRLGMAFETKPSSAMSKVDLAHYDVVVIPGGQWKTSYYTDFADNAAEFERYVTNGGTLVVEMNGAEQAGMTLPGGVNMVMHTAIDNLITLPDHPILVPLRGKPKITAVFASHGYLVGVPAGALVLATELVPGQVVADLSKPTFVEYSYGNGRVIAAAQCFHDQDGSGRGPLMVTLLQYAAARDWFPAARAPVAALQKLGSGTGLR